MDDGAAAIELVALFDGVTISVSGVSADTFTFGEVEGDDGVVFEVAVEFAVTFGAAVGKGSAGKFAFNVDASAAVSDEASVATSPFACEPESVLTASITS